MGNQDGNSNGSWTHHDQKHRGRGADTPCDGIMDTDIVVETEQPKQRTESP